ncbi:MULTISPECIES: aldo/keto reductase [unclassified Mesorhizobium]|uniref:aldo/keto reductase n=1 Tax=unclassified Mesorhizobium TaxID=325217 RepID=UPI000FD8A04F|nr:MULTISPECIES: aldo/keto reductase [unclassified Mesorhizobium]TGQ39445.1 aldo/keto reductase [Mesorhizobium sp. M00.F.Ca.ET.216.01.1.1]TIS91857.1 MAG: aldo/keto reductase [Mesorhizobium sp.]TJW38991.1 MAG: aldo/keto reductase [Mesorhizobium sp.]
MEYRTLGRSGLKVSVLTMGTFTFGGTGPFAMVGQQGVQDALRLVDLCIDAGVNLFDTSNMYSNGLSEEILGEVLDGRRDQVLISSKARMRTGTGPNDEGASRFHLIRECERSLKRLRTDHIDIYYIHEWDGATPVEEKMAALDTLVQQGKVRYIGCSNYSGWHIMKSLAVSDRDRRPRFVTQQIHYTLEAREAEYELLPISVDQGLGVLVWSPLAAGLLSGKHRRGVATPEGSRQFAGWTEPPIRDMEKLWNIVDVLVEIGDARGVSAAQVALAWLLERPGVSSLVIGGRNEAQFRDNFAAVSLRLSDEERARLTAVSTIPLIYPYWHQRNFARDRFCEADLALHRDFAEG